MTFLIEKNSAVRFGYYVSVATASLTLVTFIIAFLTPPLSGPYCVDNCFKYPYSDIGSRFPRDYYWMYTGMFLYVAYAALLVCIHRFAKPDKKVFSTLGLFFGLSAAAVLIGDFFVQVSFIPPSVALNEADGVAMISQFNPHGLFIVFEELGYLMMSISFLFFAPVFFGNKLANAVRYTFLAAGLLTFAAFIYYNATFGVYREYRFEVTAISINWLALIVGGVLLALVFKQYNTDHTNPPV